MILRESRIILLAFGLGLAYLFAVLTAQAAFDAYATASGARATAAYPDVVNAGDQFFITVNADAGSGQINSYPTAPTGWQFAGCAFVSVEVSQVGSNHKAQTVRLNMTDDTCTFYVKIVWATNLGQQNAVTIVQGSVATDNQDQNLFAKEVVESFAWVVWLAYIVLVYRLKQKALRGVGVVVGWSILFLPIGPIQYMILAAGQLALTLYVFVETTWK